MEIYFKLFEVLFPVFFIIGFGYFLGKKKGGNSLEISFFMKNKKIIPTKAKEKRAITE